MRRLHLARSFRGAVMALGPVGYWRLGEVSGTVAKDETGRNDGTYAGAPTLGVAGLLAGDPDTAVTLGTDKWISLGDQTWFDGRNPWTVAFWVDDTPDASGRCLFRKYTTAGGTNGVAFFSSSAGSNFSRYLNGSVERILPAAIQPGRHFIGCTYDGSQMVAYSDAAVLGSVASTLSVANTTADVAFGALTGDGLTPYVGTIDEPAIWTRALTASEIARLHQIGRGF